MKTMACKGRDTVRNKIVTNNNTIEKMNTFSYLGCSISYQYDKDITVKIAKFLQVMGIINRTLKPSQVQKHTRLQIYNTLVLPTILHRCETWAIREEDKPRMPAEIKFITITVKYTWQDNKTNENILLKLKINPVAKKIQNYNGYNTLGKWTEQTTAKSTMWEMKPRTTPQKTYRLLMGLEQVIRPKTLQAI
jgi:hypothetical protein